MLKPQRVGGWDWVDERDVKCKGSPVLNSKAGREPCKPLFGSAEGCWGAGKQHGQLQPTGSVSIVYLRRAQETAGGVNG